MKNNIQQENAIKTVKGPVLIIAGPGTGKTYTLVERVIYMVSELEIDPSEILISTFTNKASFELLDRLSLKFFEKNIQKDVNDMFLGNFHSIARDILNNYLDYTPLKKGYIQIDEVEQAYLIETYLYRFRKIRGYSSVINPKREVKDIVKIVNKISEDGILERHSENIIQNTILEITKLYEFILSSYNMVDFSHILLYTYKLLKENKEIRLELNKKINYIMIDEYQDTNIVQEKIIDLLLNKNRNICVVGDDDQSLYRFRGATVKNILNFTEKFEDAKIIKLMHNYRSDDSIIKFYSKFLNDLILKNPSLSDYRFNKLLFSDKISETKKVVRLLGQNEQEWVEKILSLIVDLKKYNAINSYNEIAILFNSLNDNKAKKLISFLNKNGINVYTPKTNSLITQIEVQKLVGAIYAIFNHTVEKNISYRDRDTQLFLEKAYDEFYKSSLDNEELNDFIGRMKKYIGGNSFGLNLYDICYRLFAYEPFYNYMKDEISAKKLSRFLELIKTFSLINQIHYINQSNIVDFVNRFFYSFIKFIKDQKVKEFEEDTQIPNEDTISAMTIHSSKGMEYPVVIMGSLWENLYDRYESKLDKILNSISEQFSKNNIFEPNEYINVLDFYRKYYTGFSRAKNLLVLSSFESKYDAISEHFRDLILNLEDVNIPELNVQKSEIKDNKIRKSYSYTVDIVPYKNCPIEYYYKKELKFYYPSTKSLYFGSIVHESIEYINNKLIQNCIFSKSEIKDLVTQIARQKYKLGAIMLDKDDVEKAINEVKNYYDFVVTLGRPIESELNIVHSEKNYVINGSVDMIYEKNGKHHIIDFKTGLPPKEEDDHESMESYFSQINLYAYLYKVTKNIEIETMSLYFTNQNASKNLYTFYYDEEKNKDIMNLIDKTVEKIENREFNFNELCIKENSPLKFFLNKLYIENNLN